MKTLPSVSSSDRSTFPFLICLAMLLIFLQTSCTSFQPIDRLSENGVRLNITPLDRSKNPVIFIPGAMGSHLIDRQTGRIVWGVFSKDAANASDADAIRGVSLPMEYGQPLDAIRDDVHPNSIANNIGLTLAGIRLNFPYYSGAMKRFGDAVNDPYPEIGGDQAVVCDRFLEFAYDWRRSGDENAVALSRFVKTKKAEFVRRHGYPETMKFDFITHSQGALLLRYFLRYGDQPLPRDGSRPRLTWAGSSDVENVFMLGAPNAGIPESLKHLTHGHRARPLFPKFEAVVVGSMPALYQVLPRAQDGALLDPATKSALDPLDFDLWVKNQWGLANPNQNEALQVLMPDVQSAVRRRAIALDHLKKCLSKAKQFQSALDRPARRPGHLNMVVYAGNSRKTPISFLAERQKPTLYRSGKGDGVVPLISALCCASKKQDHNATGNLYQWNKTNLCSFTHTGVANKRKINNHVINQLKTKE